MLRTSHSRSTSRALCLVSSVPLALIAAVTPAHAQPLFSDDFSQGPTLLWDNARGAWQVDGQGTYGATLPNNNPLTYTGIPYELTDLEIQCDIISIIDGGLWLHADSTRTSGVLLVLARGQIYWHQVNNGNAGAVFNPVSNVFTQGQNIHLRATIVGNTYSAYLNHSPTPITTLTTSNFPSGRFALYDFGSGGHSYDNVMLSGTCLSGDCCPIIGHQPSGSTACIGSTASLSLYAAGSGPFTYQWFKDGAPIDTIDNPSAATSTLLLPDIQETDEAVYECSITNACNTVTSTPATLIVCACLDCPADFNLDGGIDGSDVEAFFVEWEAGTCDGDTNQDGGIDGSDIETFFAAWSSGGC